MQVQAAQQVFFMAKTKKKVLAQKLRRKGLSISEIARKLNMQKSGTISRWCRDIALTSEQIERLVAKKISGSYKGRIKFLERVRRERIRETKLMRKEGIKEIGKLDKRNFFIAGVAMYLSEGFTSSSSEEVSFSNSDPYVILFMLKWFKKICKVNKDKFTIQVRINRIHKDRIKKVESYWLKLTGIPLSQFTKTILIKAKSKKIYPNHDSHYGNVRIKVLQGTKLRRKINGWVEGLIKTAT